jgi:pimeloyl-ACP methyl ester carboxylesterase
LKKGDNVQHVDLGYAKIAVELVGDRGPVLVLAHGFPLDHGMWQYQIEHFASQARVIAMDLRGFGQSRGGEGSCSMADYADDCAATLKALGVEEPVVFCGLSMGGYVAWQFWKRHREMLGQLILCDTRAEADTEEVARGRNRMAFDVLARGSAFVADAMLPRLMSPETYEQFPERVEALRQVMIKNSPEAIAMAQRAMASRVNATRWLSQIDVPTLGICGVDDEISRVDEMENMVREMPQARLVVIPAAGHMAPFENPVKVNEAIEVFLRETHPVLS